MRTFRNGPGAYTARDHTRPLMLNPSGVGFRQLPATDRHVGASRAGPRQGLRLPTDPARGRGHTGLRTHAGHVTSDAFLAPWLHGRPTLREPLQGQILS